MTADVLVAESSRVRTAGSLILCPPVRDEGVSGRETCDLPSRGGSTRRAVGVELLGSLEQANEPHGQRSVGLAHQFGTSLSDLYAHS